MRKIRKKLHSERGVSLTEMLVTLIIVMMVMTLITTIIVSAVNIYRSMQFKSESSVLMSTVNTAVNDLLAYSDDVKTAGDENAAGKTVTGLRNMETYNAGDSTYYNFGINGGMLTVDSDGHLAYTAGSGARNTSVLVSTGVYGDMTVDDLSVRFNETENVFTYSYRVTDKTGEKTADSGEMKVASLKMMYN